jgi:hypothetical protein
MKVYWIKNASGISIIIDGKDFSITKSHTQYNEIVEALLAKDWDKVRTLANLKASINKAHELTDRLYIKGASIYFKDKNGKEIEINMSLSSKIVEDLGNGYNPKALINFLDNLLDNPSKETINELYDFLKSGKVLITEDGHFIAYKKVRSTYFDIHSNTMNNAVGETVKIDREKVDTNRHNTCSVGLHFCSHGYLAYYSSAPNDRIVVVKINPADVVAIPVDYSFQKGRAWKYEVVGELTGDTSKDVFESNFVSETTKNKVAKNIKWQSDILLNSSSAKSKFKKSAIVKAEKPTFTNNRDCLEIYRPNGPGSKPVPVIKDLNGRWRNVETGQFVASGKISTVKWKSYKRAVKGK